jgi:integrase
VANIARRRNGDGTVAFTALVRIRPFAPTARSFPDKRAAKAWADALERELREQRQAGGLRPDATTLTVSDLIREFEADPVNVGRKAAADMTKLLGWWRDYCGTVKALELNVLRLREARERLSNSGQRMVWNGEGRKVARHRAPATVVKHLAAMRSVWNWSRRAGLVPVGQLWPPGLGLTLPRQVDRFLPDDELTRVLKAAEAAGPLMNAAVTVSILSGIRQGELLGLTWANVDLDKATLRLIDTKNGTSLAVYLAPPAVDALRVLREQPVTSLVHVFVVAVEVKPERAGDKPTMRIIPLDGNRLVSRWKKIQKAAGVSGVRWHDLRHCAASYLAQAGASLPEIGSALGHKSTASTARYAHLVAGRALPAHAAVAQKLLDARAVKLPQAGEGAA